MDNTGISEEVISHFGGNGTIQILLDYSQALVGYHYCHLLTKCLVDVLGQDTKHETFPKSSRQLRDNSLVWRSEEGSHDCKLHWTQRN